ncbi:MAG TPA: hypothetical protein VGJ93_11425 [Desulfuromonadaceae bacterium]
MTHYMTSRVNEMLGLQIATIQDLSRNLRADDLEHLERDISAMESAINELKSMLVSLPHQHEKQKP